MLSDYKSNLLPFSLGAQCVLCSPTEPADGTCRTYSGSRSWPTRFSQVPIHPKRMDKRAVGRLTALLYHFELGRSSPSAWDLSFPALWLPRAISGDSSSARGCLLHINAPGAGLMSLRDNNTLLHMLIRRFPNPCNCQVNNKNVLRDPAPCCTPRTYFHGKCHCLRLPFALKSCLKHGGRQGEGLSIFL